MLKIKPSLTARVTLWLTLFSVSLLLIFGFLTFFVTLVYEDAMVHKMLRHASQNSLAVNGVFTQISIDQLIDFGYQLQTKAELSQGVNTFGEFSKGKDYYHFMILQDAVLLMKSTDFVMSNHQSKQISMLLIKAFFPCLLITFWLSRVIAKRALKPFSLLTEQFSTADSKAADIHQFNQHIRETDIKQIANGLATVLSQKEAVLGQQITFNQGLSHELRTPLQVMTHAAEILALKHPEITQQDAYQRIAKSIQRMHRMSESLLWLTTNTESQESIEVNQHLLSIIDELEQTYHQHRLKIQLTEQGKLSLPIPQSVFDFIIHSLATNAVNHAAHQENGDKRLQVVITETSLTLSNRINRSCNMTANTQNHFGVGLLLVGKLCRRFHIKPITTHGDQDYTIALYAEK